MINKHGNLGRNNSGICFSGKRVDDGRFSSRSADGPQSLVNSSIISHNDHIRYHCGPTLGPMVVAAFSRYAGGAMDPASFEYDESIGPLVSSFGRGSS